MAVLVYSVVRLPRQGVGRFNLGDFWWLLIALGPLILVLVPLLRLLRPSRPESITLGPDFFRHRLGRASGQTSLFDPMRFREVDRRPLWRRVWGATLVIEVAKEEMGPVILDRVGQLRLRYDIGADRIEIGRYLREPEKEWLAAVIKEWQKTT
jgi:hypothetical protein